MQFLYHENSGAPQISLQDSSLHYICNVRRFRVGDSIKLSNMKDNFLFHYRIESKLKKEIILNLKYKEAAPKANFGAHIIQGIIDHNEFYKNLPLLNELMVSKITLFYADFSQKQFRFNINRIDKILISSCMQCARVHKMDIEFMPNLDSILDIYPHSMAFDFNNEVKNDIFKNCKSFIIGPEGGFSLRERKLLEGKSFALNHNLILKSSTASVFIAAKSLEL